MTSENWHGESAKAEDQILRKNILIKNDRWKQQFLSALKSMVLITLIAWLLSSMVLGAVKQEISSYYSKGSLDCAILKNQKDMGEWRIVLAKVEKWNVKRDASSVGDTHKQYITVLSAIYLWKQKRNKEKLCIDEHLESIDHVLDACSLSAVLSNCLQNTGCI